MIFFSAHGVPLAYVEEAGDPYKAEMEECVDLIMEELEKRKITNAYTLAYQVTTFSLIRYPDITFQKYSYMKLIYTKGK